MYSNLISAGWLRVQQSYSAQLKQEVAKLYKKSASAIQKIQCWPHLLWVVIEGVGARFVSYRSLPTWINKVITVICQVANFEQLEELGEILRCETQNHFYEQKGVQHLREAYRQKQQELNEMKPQLEHQKKAQNWLRNWQGIVEFCQTEESLNSVVKAIEMQSGEFADLPEVIAAIRKTISNQFLVISDFDF